MKYLTLGTTSKSQQQNGLQMDLPHRRGEGVGSTVTSPEATSELAHGWLESTAFPPDAAIA
jgi:hypothetical protein